VIPDKVWEAILTQGGLGGAVSLLVVFIALACVGFLWRALRDSQVALIETRRKTAEDIKAAYEDRIRAMEDLLAKVSGVVDRNTSTLADNSRVVEARAEAIREMASTLTKLVASYEAYQSNMRSQADRVESALTRLLEVVRPPPPSRR
jgi:methyl-accepting chemotaxis protein